MAGEETQVLFCPAGGDISSSGFSLGVRLASATHAPECNVFCCCCLFFSSLQAIVDHHQESLACKFLLPCKAEGRKATRQIVGKKPI